MSYLVFARKYRPASFSSVRGQEHVTRTLSNAIGLERVAHAYLFCGPRGVGKTSVARILAKTLNCLSEGGPDSEETPCENCAEISSGKSLAVREIDGASHNSVDNVRDLIDSFRSLPPPGYRYKIYIVDEVHMLSHSAFNALLKSLEEPPPNTIFILATTESQKIPQTVISRCQRHDFRALSAEEIRDTLRDIAKAENFRIDSEALSLVARLADGSLRDAQSILERVRVFCGDEILSAEASKALGVVGRGTLFELTEAILAQDPGRALEVLELALSGGLDISLFLQEFVVHWRELLLASFGGEGMLSRIGVSQELQSDMTRLVQNLAAPDLQDLVFIARTGADEALRSSYPKYALEALIVRMATREPVSDLGSILRKVRTTLDSSANASSSSSAPRAASMKTSREPPVSASSFPKTRGKASESAPSLARSQTKTLPSIGSKGASQEAPKKENRILQWGEFVRASFSSCGVVLGEHLKRLCVTRFEAGLLEAEGPKFSITSLEEESLRKKLLEALEDFCPLGTPAGTSSTGATWVLRLRPLEQGIGAAQGSLEHRSKEEAKEKARERTKKIVSHPSVQTIKKIFPGSTIEKVRLEGTS